MKDESYDVLYNLQYQYSGVDKIMNKCTHTHTHTHTHTALMYIYHVNVF
jgi:hypothetical protein